MDVNYQQTNELFTSFADAICTRNIQKLETLRMSTYLHMAESMLDYQYKIASIYIPRAIYFVGYENGLLQILLSAFHKNIFAFYSAITLTEKGLFGPARTLLRYIYEGLIIAKYCSINPDVNLIQKWDEGKYINLSREVFAKIAVPDISPLKDFWGMLHSYVHSTKYAQQVSLSLDDNLYEVELNFVFIRMLLECCYHLLNRHLINPSVVYYAEAYGKNEEGKRLKKEIQKLFSASKKGMQNQPRKFIYVYKQSWKVNP